MDGWEATFGKAYFQGQIQVDICLTSSYLTRSGQGTIGTSTLQEVTTKFACASLTTACGTGKIGNSRREGKSIDGCFCMERKKHVCISIYALEMLCISLYGFNIDQFSWFVNCLFIKYDSLLRVTCLLASMFFCHVCVGGSSR